MSTVYLLLFLLLCLLTHCCQFAIIIKEVDIVKKLLSKKWLCILLIIPALILTDIIFCTGLYFFEPVNYNAADLSISDSFGLYKKYSDTSSSFYIKQITHEDIVAAEFDSRLKYVDDTILITYTDNADYDDINNLLSPYDASICGYIEEINFIQAEFPDCDYPTLTNICSELSEHESVSCAIIDYFEETPTSEENTIINEDSMDNYYYDLINYPDDISAYICNKPSVNVGVFDVLVDSNNIHLDVINKDSYDVNSLNNPLIKPFNNHGTHVAGILAGSDNCNAPAVYPNAKIVSDNAMNNSISYWVAAITDMIVNYDAKVINMSIGYNSYITLSAALGCENAIDFISNESSFFSSVLKTLIENNHEFLICTAAGNDSHSNINKIHKGYFSYGEKQLLDKFDFFNIFTERVRYSDSRYSLPFSFINDKDVLNRIIVVGSCDEYYNLSYFSSLHDRIDIIAPGEGIHSLGFENDYDYMSGTSMACPFVSGTAALLFAVNPDLTAADVKNIIINSSSQAIGNNEFEYPLLDVTKALEMAQ